MMPLISAIRISPVLRLRRTSAMSSVEMICGALILLILCLALLDLGVVVLANSISDSVVKNAARGAAGQQTPTGANTAAQQAINAVGTSPIIASLSLVSLDYNQDNN